MTPPPHHELLQQLDWVRALAARLVFDKSHRDDLAQEIWHAALKAPNASAAQPAPIRAWLTGIARHLAALLVRRDARRTRHELAAANTGTAKSAAEVAEHAELQQRLLAAVNALPEPMRDVVLLRYLEGLPPRVIAARLQVPIATVRTRLQRAMDRLRERLDADFGDRRAWALAFAALGRPRDVAAAAGALTTFTHVGLAIVNTNKLLVAGAALAALAAIPAAIVWSGSTTTTPPDAAHGDVVAAAPQQPPTTTRASDAAAPSREAAPARAFRGRVVDVDGKPLAGALVRKTPLWSFEARVESGELKTHDASATTGGDGAFTLNEAGVRGENVAVAAKLDGFVAREQTTLCRLEAAATLVMLRTHEVSMTAECVERAGRVPVPRFRVTGSTALQTRSNRVDAPVTYELRVPDRSVGTNGQWTGTARFVEGMPFVVQVCCAAHGEGPFGRGTDPRLRTTLQPAPGVPLHVVLEFDPPVPDAGGPVQRGRVVADATNEPVPGADVFYIARTSDSMSYGSRAHVRADGTFVLGLPKNGASVTLHVEHDDWQTATLRPQPDQEIVVRLRPRASLQVQVVDRTGAPVAGAHVLVCAVRDERFQRRARTDADGRVALTQLPADRYMVFLVPNASAPDEMATTNASYTLEPGQQLAAKLELESSSAVPVRGRIAGAPAGLTAAFLPHSGSGRFAPARLNGSDYDAGALQPGDYLVLLMPANDDDHHLLFALLPNITVRGPGPQGIDLALPTGFVRGRVTTRDRTSLRVMAVPEVPAGGVAADLLARAKTAAFLGVSIAEDGSFAVKHVADGRWHLQLRDGATVVAQRAVTVRGSLDVGDWSVDR
ncbi:MAG TPA: sigma-70 family RNA polymerase sigma factor [Planctomycetota bacterium]|nr:sigma-70 family RNA polymerase sigma factor [Planctomycetota bacterium]